MYTIYSRGLLQGLYLIATKKVQNCFANCNQNGPKIATKNAKNYKKLQKNANYCEKRIAGWPPSTTYFFSLSLAADNNRCLAASYS